MHGRPPLAGHGSRRTVVRPCEARAHVTVSPPDRRVRISSFRSNSSAVGPVLPAAVLAVPGSCHATVRYEPPGRCRLPAQTTRVSPSSAGTVVWTDRGFGNPSHTRRSEPSLGASQPHRASTGGAERPGHVSIAHATRAEGIQFEARDSHQCGPPRDPGGHSGGRPSCRDPL